MPKSPSRNKFIGANSTVTSIPKSSVLSASKFLGPKMNVPRLTGDRSYSFSNRHPLANRTNTYSVKFDPSEPSGPKVPNLKQHRTQSAPTSPRSNFTSQFSSPGASTLTGSSVSLADSRGSAPMRFSDLKTSTPDIRGRSSSLLTLPSPTASSISTADLRRSLGDKSNENDLLRRQMANLEVKLKRLEELEKEVRVLTAELEATKTSEQTQLDLNTQLQRLLERQTELSHQLAEEVTETQKLLESEQVTSATAAKLSADLGLKLEEAQSVHQEQLEKYRRAIVVLHSLFEEKSTVLKAFKQDFCALDQLLQKARTASKTDRHALIGADSELADLATKMDIMNEIITDQDTEIERLREELNSLSESKAEYEALIAQKAELADLKIELTRCIEIAKERAAHEDTRNIDLVAIKDRAVNALTKAKESFQLALLTLKQEHADDLKKQRNLSWQSMLDAVAVKRAQLEEHYAKFPRRNAELTAEIEALRLQLSEAEAAQRRLAAETFIPRHKSQLLEGELTALRKAYAEASQDYEHVIASLDIEIYRLRIKIESRPELSLSGPIGLIDIHTHLPAEADLSISTSSEHIQPVSTQVTSATKAAELSVQVRSIATQKTDIPKHSFMGTIAAPLALLFPVAGLSYLTFSALALSAVLTSGLSVGIGVMAASLLSAKRVQYPMQKAVPAALLGGTLLALPFILKGINLGGLALSLAGLPALFMVAIVLIGFAFRHQAVLRKAQNLRPGTYPMYQERVHSNRLSAKATCQPVGTRCHQEHAVSESEMHIQPGAVR